METRHTFFQIVLKLNMGYDDKFDKNKLVVIRLIMHVPKLFTLETYN